MEAKITINGVELNDAQKMTLHVALQSYAMDIQQKDALGDDYHGHFMQKAYLENIRQITNLYMKSEVKEIHSQPTDNSNPISTLKEEIMEMIGTGAERVKCVRYIRQKVGMGLKNALSFYEECLRGTGR